MSNRDEEVRHLAQADLHIANVKMLIRRLERMVEASREGGEPSDQAIRAIDTMKRALDDFYAHRDEIVKTLRDIDDGKI